MLAIWRRIGLLRKNDASVQLLNVLIYRRSMVSFLVRALNKEEIRNIFESACAKRAMLKTVVDGK